MACSTLTQALAVTADDEELRARVDELEGTVDELSAQLRALWAGIALGVVALALSAVAPPIGFLLGGMVGLFLCVVAVARAF